MTTKESTQQKTQAQQDYEKGVAFLKDKDLSQAAAAFHNALVGFEQDADENGMANAADKLGDICLEKKEFAKAMIYFDRAYEICLRHTDRFSLFCLERKKARVYDEAGDYQKAIEAYVDVVDEFNALRDPQGAVAALETMAEIYLKMSNKVQAADCYRTIASIHKHFKHSNISLTYMDKAAAIEADH